MNDTKLKSVKKIKKLAENIDEDNLNETDLNKICDHVEKLRLYVYQNDLKSLLLQKYNNNSQFIKEFLDSLSISQYCFEKNGFNYEDPTEETSFIINTNYFRMEYKYIFFVNREIDDYNTNCLGIYRYDNDIKHNIEYDKIRPVNHWFEFKFGSELINAWMKQIVNIFDVDINPQDCITLYEIILNIINLSHYKFNLDGEMNYSQYDFEILDENSLIDLTLLKEELEKKTNRKLDDLFEDQQMIEKEKKEKEKNERNKKVLEEKRKNLDGVYRKLSKMSPSEVMANFESIFTK
jgi:hypothetical protein